MAAASAQQLYNCSNAPPPAEGEKKEEEKTAEEKKEVEATEEKEEEKKPTSEESKKEEKPPETPKPGTTAPQPHPQPGTTALQPPLVEVENPPFAQQKHTQKSEKSIVAKNMKNIDIESKLFQKSPIPIVEWLLIW
ncbi:protein QUIRKY-like [Forsythia ovata]|uniref:Protein QUIRKY-like n=1 Tax=Forsythia ovata TaxID=205694 RepID=A0ABD1SPS5_9LAMI